jgi:hypothetical protein
MPGDSGIMPAPQIIEADIGPTVALVIAPQSHYASHHLPPHYIIVLSRRFRPDGPVAAAIIQFLNEHRPRYHFTILCASMACLFGGRQDLTARKDVLFECHESRAFL